MCITIKGTELLTQFLHPHSPYALLSASMHDQGQGVNGLVVQQKNHLIRTDEFGNFCETVGFVPSRDYFVCNRRPHNFWTSRVRLDRRPLSTDLLEAGKSRTTALELVKKIRYYFA